MPALRIRGIAVPEEDSDLGDTEALVTTDMLNIVLRDKDALQPALFLYAGEGSNLGNTKVL